MNKKILYIILLSGILILPVSAYALDFNKPTENSFPTIQSIVEALLNPIWEVFVGFSVIAFVIAGITFLTAQGDPKKLETARSAVIWGTVGIVVGILAFSIMTIIRDAMGA